MRYNVHPLRAVRHRIARHIGVLVCAALVAALGLPSVAQAQTPAAPTIEAEGNGMVGSNGTIMAMWGRPLATDSGQDQWLVEYTEPGVAWDDATEIVIENTDHYDDRRSRRE